MKRSTRSERVEPPSERRVKASARTAAANDASPRKTDGERLPSLELETQALAESPAVDSLRANILRLVALGAYTELFGEGGVCHEDALLGFAAATNKAVALALLAGPQVCVDADSFGDVAFDTKDAVRVLLGVSALLDAAPKLLSSVRHADAKADLAREAEPGAAE